jgi:hypothetical protein
LHQQLYHICGHFSSVGNKNTEKRYIILCHLRFERILADNLQSIAWLQSMTVFYHIDRGIDPDLGQHMWALVKQDQILQKDFRGTNVEKLLKGQSLTHGKHQPLTSLLVVQHMLLCGLSKRVPE